MLAHPTCPEITGGLSLNFINKASFVKLNRASSRIDLLNSVLVVLLILWFVPVTSMAATAWTVRKTSWSEVDEKQYSEFVHSVGKSLEKGECHSFSSCMQSSGNTYKGGDLANTSYGLVDCGRLSYGLRSYFAWKNGLPFGYVTGVDGAGGDLRYSPDGNHPTSRVDLINPNVNANPDGLLVMRNMIDSVNTAMYRYHPKSDAVLGKPFPDFYPVAIQKGSIVPGTVIYDPNGHAATVYEVSDDGRIKYIDAHPDQSMTRGTYDQRFVRSRPGMGAGFKRWRPLQLVGATKIGDEFVGGHILGSANKDIKDYSMDQFYGNDPKINPTRLDGSWSAGRFLIKDKSFEYYEWVRTSLATGELRYEPLQELKSMISDSCDYFKDRVGAVQMSIDKNIAVQPHPGNLPNNIYGTDGDWELYSTPSRDAELKTSLKGMYDQVVKFVNWKKQSDPRLVYADNV